jgi:predicted NACHT family NTPase
MLRHLWNWVTGNTWAFGGLCALAAVLITVFIGPSIKAAATALWDKLKTLLSGRQFENTYLEWIIAENRYLPTLPTTLVPVTEGYRHELDQLYVSLSICGDPKAADQSLAEVLRTENKVVILGDPGCGKTTMLKFLALTFARARRRRPTASNEQERTESAQKVRKAIERVAAEFGFAFSPLPVFVMLNRFRDVNNWPRSRSLLDQLREEWMSVDRLRRFPEQFFENKLRAGQCIFLFDAFDELGSEDARGDIARRVGELANAEGERGNRFIVTSRIIGYSGQFSQYGFAALTVKQLSWKQMTDLVNNWYATLSQPALAEELLKSLEANPRVKELALNPMLLSLIALVQYVQRIIPERRDVLYDTCVKILIERRYAPATVRQAYDQVLPAEDALVVLRKTAHTMHEQHVREIPRDRLENSIIPAILASMPHTRAAIVPSADILHNIEERSQLLIERGLDPDGQPLMAFSHLTFQEYLTSVYLNRLTATKGMPEVMSLLLGYYAQDPDWWEEVALLFGAQLDPSAQEAFFQQVYPPRNEGPLIRGESSRSD